MLETRLATFEDLHAIFLLVEKNYCENKALNQFDFADEKVYVIIKNLIGIGILIFYPMKMFGLKNIIMCGLANTKKIVEHGYALKKIVI